MSAAVRRRPVAVVGRRAATRVGAVAGLLLLLVALLLAPAAPASAHAVLVSSSPAASAVVPSAPSEVVLTFSEGVRTVPGKIRVIAPDGSRADRGEPSVQGAVITIPVDPGGARGTYLVSFRVISADSHPVPGAFTYSVGAPSPPPVDSGTDNRADPVVENAVKVAKYLGYAGLLLLVGPALVLAALWPRRLSRRGPARLAWAGLGLLTFATLAELWLQVPYTAGGGLLDVTGSGLSDMLGSAYGTAHLVRLGLLAAAAFLLRPLFAGPIGRSDGIILTILGGAAIFTWPLAGHPAASPAPAVSVLVDAVHLGSMAVWLGGLVMLVVFLLRRADERELGAILPIWSRWAALAVAALLLAGTVQGLIEVATPKALVDTTYGRLLLIKIGLFVLVLGVAAYSRALVRRRTAAQRPVTLRRLIGVELAITAVVLGVSATLVQTTPARTATTQVTGTPAGYWSTTLSSPIYSLQVELDPAERGNNSVHLYAYTKDNRPQPVKEWKATAALPSAGIEPIEIPLLPLTDNHATGEINFPAAGEWQLRFTVRTSDIDQATVTATVPIK
ncbi:copper resistance protein CopC [Micromonospora globispora]|uniref:Copper resistance protein CopC n=1 Tax=Micromonospora globispora TaxID=1450148 RepID=A0A317KJE9_9ACTN|nr:copper resistance protein CopC [Micromonospora globispora]PWU53115.1 copper resistance protein CopC [Micromonospora globispora]PWU56417.1 copper resistance protein CopC [Micromonospora globispora]RQW98861.1 copper resistance protein CopC [Micromonospora globispora]